MDAAQEGDTVLVAPGTYTGPGNRELDPGGRAMVILAEEGPEVTIIDPAYEGRAFLVRSGEGPGMEIRGFTIRRGGDAGWNDGGGAYVRGSHLRIVDCRFEACQGDLAAGICVTDGAAAEILDCIIRGNEGGAPVAVSDGSKATIRGCLITENEAEFTAGIGAGGDGTEVLVEDTVVSGNFGVFGVNIIGYGATAEFADCLVSGNSAIDTSGGFLVEGGTLILRNSTVAANWSPGAGANVYVRWGGDLIAERTVFYSVLCSDQIRVDSYARFTCCAIWWADVSGDGTVEFVGDQVEEDPLFCDGLVCGAAPTTEGDYHLQSNSPCLPESSPCGELIGALGVGCEPPPSPVEGMTWGRIKARWGRP
jgi:hypothetical protein